MRKEDAQSISVSTTEWSLRMPRQRIAPGRKKMRFMCLLVRLRTHRKIPDSYKTVTSGTCNPAETGGIGGLARTPSDRIYAPLVPFQDKDALPLVLRRSLPDPYRSVIRGRRQVVSVWRPCKGPDSRGMARESRAAVPIILRIVYVKFYGVVVGCGCQDLR